MLVLRMTPQTTRFLLEVLFTVTTVIVSKHRTMLNLKMTTQTTVLSGNSTVSCQLLACLTLLAECENELIQPIDTQYDDKFSSDVTKQHNITKWFIKLLDIREKLLSQDNPPEA